MNIFIRTALITLVVFFAGIGLGLMIGGEKVSSLERTVAELNSDISDIELHFLFMDVMSENVPCNYFLNEAERLGSITDEMGREVERYEQSDRLRDKDFVELKQRYTSMLMRNWLTLEKIKLSCDSEYITILYFYDRNNCDRCEEQGLILSNLKDKLGRDVMVFAIDAGINMRMVEGLKESYDIETYPTLIVNGNKYTGYHNQQETRELVCSYNHALSVC